MKTSSALPAIQHQPSFEGSSWHETSPQNLPELFKRIYYRLYTNSNASRAEVIVEDLSLLLLCKLAAELSGSQDTIEDFI